MDVVLSAFITGGNDPFCTTRTKLGKEGRPADLSDVDKFAYIQPFVATVAEHRLHGVLLHDGLPQSFVEKHSTDLLSIVRVEAVPEQSNHERRFAAYREWLADKSGRVWLVDVNDIAFTEHPFRWWDSLPLRDDVILCGEEHNPYRGNPWFEDALALLPNQYGNLLLEQHGALLALNCGAWGARCDIALGILDDMIAQFAPTRSHAARLNARFSVTLDMYAFAWTLLTMHAGRIATFRMNGDHPLSNPGVTLRHFRSPLVHDRPSALAYLTKTHGFKFRPGTSDRETFEAVAIDNEYRLPADMQGQRVLDVGGHIGSFAYACSIRGASVWSVEADPDNVAILREHLGRLERCQVIFAAAWRSDRAETTLHIGGGGNNTGGRRILPDGGQLTRALPFDRIVDEMTDNGKHRIDLLKLDCEGSEFPILFTSHRLHLIDAICAELHPWAKTCPGLAADFDVSEASLRRLLADFDVEVSAGHLWAKRRRA